MATLIFSGLGLASFFFIQEATKAKSADSGHVPEKGVIKESIHFALQNKVVLGLILLTTVIFSGNHLFDDVFQPYLKNNRIPIQYFGAFYTELILFQAFGTRMTSHLMKKFKFFSLLSLSSLGIVLGIFLMTLNLVKVFIYLIPVIIGIPLGIFITINDIAMNQLVESNIRASVLSFQHSLSKVLQIILYLGVGFSLDHSSIRFSILLLAITLLVSIIMIFLCFRRFFNQRILFNEQTGNV